MEKKKVLEGKELANCMRKLIEDELDAQHEYEEAIARIKEPKIAKILKDILEEEMVHQGQLEAIIGMVEPEQREKIHEGKMEAMHELGDDVVKMIRKWKGGK